MDADRHLKQLESRDLVNLPSAAPRVLMELRQAHEATLVLRYSCRPNDRVKVEQAILRAFLQHRGAASGRQPRDARILAEAA